MSEQEQLWRGEFGDQYNTRNIGKVPSNIAFFAKALARTQGINYVIELGCGIGQNLQAIKQLMPNVEVMGVEINEDAALRVPVGYVFRASIFDFQPPVEVHVDLAFTKGLLIHISPDDIGRAYEKLYECSQRYILIAEYYNPSEQMVKYRGMDNALWKRDFCLDMLSRYPDMRLIDYGFQYRGDPNWPQDDLHWFLMEKI